MRGREPIVPQRRRRIPPQFSWVDHRLVRDGHVQGRSASALALYLFLITVADADGLSWYSEAALCRYLSWSGPQLHHARVELQQAGLIAYRKPLYQVLDLSSATAPSRPSSHACAPRACPRDASRRASTRRDGQAVPLGEILTHIMPACAGTADRGGAR